MRRKWIGLAAGAVILAGAAGVYLTIHPPGDIDIEGRWVLAEGSEDCYAGLRFMRGMTPAEGGASTETHEGNVIRMAYGTYAKNGATLALTMSNPPSEQIEMSFARQDARLLLDYTLGGEQLSCTYVLKKG
ncbi:hypothetical protein [Paenibacillus sp. 1P07SE]|uniref:hypothetical protein n=1 Tax=Paenibacillus sp. 1P07SE TaxID=3132209 RepID=UPI0039A60462